jgi:hypothetical protein
MNPPGNSPTRALRLGRLLAVLAVWAGVLGYVIPAAFSAGSGASATEAAVASHSPGGQHAWRGARLDPHRPNHPLENAMVRVIQVRPGTWTVRVVGVGEQASARVTLAAGSSNTLVVLDGRSRLAIRVQQDSVGIKATARDAADPGGTAPRSGWPPVAWLAPAATALLLGLAWLARLRQFRWARRAAARIR